MTLMDGLGWVGLGDECWAGMILNFQVLVVGPTPFHFMRCSGVPREVVTGLERVVFEFLRRRTPRGLSVSV